MFNYENSQSISGSTFRLHSPHAVLHTQLISLELTWPLGSARCCITEASGNPFCLSPLNSLKNTGLRATWSILFPLKFHKNSSFVLWLESLKRILHISIPKPTKLLHCCQLTCLHLYKETHLKILFQKQNVILLATSFKWTHAEKSLQIFSYIKCTSLCVHACIHIQILRHCEV